MNRNRAVLARHAAARLIAAACRDKRDLWNAQEQLHEQTTTQAEACAAAEPLLRICANCQIVAECRAWASVDDYTGIAAGATWVNGKQKPVDWVRLPPRRLAG